MPKSDREITFQFQLVKGGGGGLAELQELQYHPLTTHGNTLVFVRFEFQPF